MDIKKIDKLISESNYNGAILIAENEKVLLNKGYGYACFEHDVLFSKDTISRVASLTKLFTATAILKLVEDNLIKLDDTLDKYIPEFKEANKIKIMHLLANSSGIKTFDISMDFYEISKSNDIIKSLIDLVKESGLNFEPGEKYDYTITGYLVLQYIIELVTKMTYEEYLSEIIFKPLELINTGFDYPNRIVKNKAFGYTYNNDILEKSKYFDMRIAGGAGGLYSNCEDIYKFDKALMNNQLLKEEYVKLLFSKHISIDKINSYGYGIVIAEWEKEGISYKKLYHPGGGDGVRSFNTIYPEKGLYVVMISNIDTKTTFNELIDEIDNILLN